MNRNYQTANLGGGAFRHILAPCFRKISLNKISRIKARITLLDVKQGVPLYHEQCTKSTRTQLHAKS